MRTRDFKNLSNFTFYIDSLLGLIVYDVRDNSFYSLDFKRSKLVDNIPVNEIQKLYNKLSLFNRDFLIVFSFLEARAREAKELNDNKFNLEKFSGLEIFKEKFPEFVI